MSSERHSVFISYKNEDANLARQLADGLQAAGVRVWFAEYVALSVNYDDFDSALEQRLREGIEASTHAVMITNRQWSASDFCQKEWEWIQEYIRSDCVIQVPTLGRQCRRTGLPSRPSLLLAPQRCQRAIWTKTRTA